MYATIYIIKIANNFPKMRGGVKGRFWNFSKNSSDLVAGSFPYSSLKSRSIAQVFLVLAAKLKPLAVALLCATISASWIATV